MQQGLVTCVGGKNDGTQVPYRGRTFDLLSVQDHDSPSDSAQILDPVLLCRETYEVHGLLLNGEALYFAVPQGQGIAVAMRTVFDVYSNTRERKGSFVRDRDSPA